MDTPDRQSRAVREAANQRRKFRVAGKAEELRFHALVRGIAAILVLRSIVNEKPVPRHPMR
jgi:hypothetical protein